MQFFTDCRFGRWNPTVERRLDPRKNRGKTREEKAKTTCSKLTTIFEIFS